MGARPELARSYMVNARVLRAAGQPGLAMACMANAVALFQQMRMSWDLARAEQEPGQGA
jgi:hypothetical protein